MIDLLKEKAKLWYRAWKYRYRADVPEMRWMLGHLHPGDVAFDIGAHKGAYAFWMRQATGRKGRVVAFEPQAKGAQLLRRLFGSGVRVEEIGLSHQAGTQRFYIQPQNNLVSYEASLENKYADAIVHEIRTDTLDGYCARTGLRPAFLKIDVEGHELEVLRGGTEMLRSSRPRLLLELERRHVGAERMQEVFTFLEGAGYRGYFFEQGRRQPLAAFDADKHQSAVSLKGSQQAYINNFIFEPLT